MRVHPVYKVAERVRAELQKHGVAPDHLREYPDEGPVGMVVLTYARSEQRRRAPARLGPGGPADGLPPARELPLFVQSPEEVREPARAVRLTLSVEGLLAWIVEDAQEQESPELLLRRAEGGLIWAARLVHDALRAAGAGTMTMPPSHARCLKCRGRARRHHLDCPRRALDTSRNRAIRRAIIRDAIRRHQRVLADRPAWFVAEARRARERLDLSTDQNGNPSQAPSTEAVLRSAT